MNEQSFFQEKPETNIFVQLLQKYLPFWPLFALTIPIALSVSFIYLKTQVPNYVATAKVLLKDPNKGTGDSKVLDALNIFSEKKIVDNEILVLKSSSIVQEVVKDLDLYAAVYNQGKVREEELYKQNSPIRFIAIQQDSIIGYSKYYFTINWKNRTVGINNLSVPFDSSVVLGNTAYRLVINNNYSQNLVGKNYYVLINPVAGVAAAISGGIRAAPLSNVSTVLDVSLQTSEPIKGEAILTKLFEVYNAEGIEDKNQIASKTLSFIENRLSLVIFQLDSVERNIVSYKSKQSLYAVGSQADLFLSKVQELDKRKADVDLQLDMLDEIQKYIELKGKKTGTVPSLNLVTDPTLSGLLGQLYSAEFELDKAISISGLQSEPVILANEKIRRLKVDIEENLNNIRASLLTIKNDIITRTNLNNNLLSQVPQKERGLLEISRQQAVKNSIYSYLLQKREETALSSASTSSDLRVIEKPSSYGPVTPVPKNYYLTGFIVGLLSAVFLVLMKEQFKNKVLFRDEIEGKTSVPFVGEIVQASTKSPIVILEGKRTVIAEQFRALRTSLSYIGFNEENKTLLVTSSISSEGKSFISINLAISLTLTGKKVALMEMDLRKPKLSKLMEVQRDPGISNYIVGKASFEEVIRETSIPNLYIVPAGVIPPNPTELIGKPGFKALMEQIKSKFDYVIIDTAPIGPVTDALLLNEFCDVTLYVIRHDRTPKIFLRMMNELNGAKKFNNMCIVFNGVKKRGISIGSINNSYGYG